MGDQESVRSTGSRGSSQRVKKSEKLCSGPLHRGERPVDPGSDKGPPLHTSWQRHVGAQADRAVVSQLDKEETTRREGKGMGKDSGLSGNSGRRTAWLQRVLGGPGELCDSAETEAGKDSGTDIL